MAFDRDAFADLYPFSSHYLEIRGGLRYHYLDEGSGPVVVMLHGNPTWSFYFRNLVMALRDSHRVIVPDHIGCGLSDKPGDDRYNYCLQSRVEDLEFLLDELLVGGEKVSLVLHDWGGMIGMTYAVRHPERIARFVVTNTAGFLMPEGKGLPWRLWVIRSVLPFAAVAVRGLNAFAGLATWMASYKGLDSRVKEGLVAPYDSWGNRIATLRFVQDIPLAEGDPSYEICLRTDREMARLFQGVPMLICWGLRDFVFDRDYLAEWQRRFPGAEVYAFEDAGHYSLEDVPDRIVPLVEGFFGGGK